MGAVSLEQGAYLVGLARRAIGEYFASGRKIGPQGGESLPENGGLFVTLETYPGRELRGCIGFRTEHPVPLTGKSVVEAALSAAFEDPRFPPLEERELEKTVIEVSVLSAPEEIAVKSPEEYPGKIKVGRDGLSISYGYSSGLLLPQVPVEWNWNEAEFLSHLCEKAGLPRSMWKSPSVKISRFSAQVFSEESPGGKVVRKRLIR